MITPGFPHHFQAVSTAHTAPQQLQDCPRRTLRRPASPPAFGGLVPLCADPLALIYSAAIGCLPAPPHLLCPELCVPLPF